MGTRGETWQVKILLLAAVAVGLGAAIMAGKVVPDVNRYLRIRRMYEEPTGRMGSEPPAVADEPVLERLPSLMTKARCFDLHDPQMLRFSDVPTY
jgi:hypothetical protein